MEDAEATKTSSKNRQVLVASPSPLSAFAGSTVLFVLTAEERAI